MSFLFYYNWTSFEQHYLYLVHQMATNNLDFTNSKPSRRHVDFTFQSCFISISNMVIQVIEFQGSYSKLNIFLAKNQYPQRKLKYFVNWCIGESSKILQNKPSQKLKLSKTHFTKNRKVPLTLKDFGSFWQLATMSIYKIQ